MNDTRDKYHWFAQQEKGILWRPVTREGWAVCIGYIVILIWDFARIDTASNSLGDVLIAFAPDFAVLTVLFLLVVFAKAEAPRFWQKRKTIH